MPSEHLENSAEVVWATSMTIIYGSFLELDCYWSSLPYTTQSSMNILLTTHLMTWLKNVQVFNNTKLTHSSLSKRMETIPCMVKNVAPQGWSKSVTIKRSNMLFSRVLQSFKTTIRAIEIVLLYETWKPKSQRMHANKFKPFP